MRSIMSWDAMGLVEAHNEDLSCGIRRDGE